MLKLDLFGSKKERLFVIKTSSFEKRRRLNYELTDIIKHNPTNIVGEYKIDTIKGD